MNVYKACIKVHGRREFPGEENTCWGAHSAQMARSCSAVQAGGLCWIAERHLPCGIPQPPTVSMVVLRGNKLFIGQSLITT